MFWYGIHIFIKLLIKLNRVIHKSALANGKSLKLLFQEFVDGHGCKTVITPKEQVKFSTTFYQFPHMEQPYFPVVAKISIQMQNFLRRVLLEPLFSHGHQVLIWLTIFLSSSYQMCYFAFVKFVFWRNKLWRTLK